MTTRRLIDETQDLIALRLLRSAQLDTPPRGSMARTAAAIGVSSLAVAGTASLGVSGVATTSSKGILWILLKGLLVGGATGAVVIGGGTWISDQALAPAADGVVTESDPDPSTVATSTAVIEEPPVSEPEGEPEVEPPVVREVQVPPPVGLEAGEAVARFDGDDRATYLAAEIAALDRARSLLRSGRTAAALAELDRYESTTQTRELAAEAEALRVEALVAAGRRADAAVLARRLLETQVGGTRRAYLERIAVGE